MGNVVRESDEDKRGQHGSESVMVIVGKVDFQTFPSPQRVRFGFAGSAPSQDEIFAVKGVTRRTFPSCQELGRRASRRRLELFVHQLISSAARLT